MPGIVGAAGMAHLVFELARVTGDGLVVTVDTAGGQEE